MLPGPTDWGPSHEDEAGKVEEDGEDDHRENVGQDDRTVPSAS